MPVVGRSNAAAAVQNRMAGREKVHGLPHDPATPLLGLHTKELKAGTHTPIFAAVLFTKSKGRNHPNIWR